MNPIDSLLIDGKPELLRNFVIPEMSLSSSRATMTRHSFAFGINAVRLADLLDPLYVSLVDELRDDDVRCGSSQDALACAGYPIFSEVLKEPELTEVVLGTYLLHDWLGRFTWDGVAPVKYWLDEITHCEITGDQITLSGVCFS